MSELDTLQEVEAVKKKKAWKPRRVRGQQPTLTGQPQLGYLNSFYCPICGKHLFSCYDADIAPDRKDGFRFRVASDWHYCSKCGTMLDLAEWQQEETPAPAAVVGADDELKFDE